MVGLSTAHGTSATSLGATRMDSLASGEVHCWCADLEVPRSTLARFYASLSAEERHRSARFQFLSHQQEYVVSHGVLRSLLGRHLEISPERIRYRYNPFGKPDLSAELGGRLRFNLSHSGGLALIAIVAGCDVGVDLECTRNRWDYMAIARSFFSAAEVDALSALPAEGLAEAFVRFWTQKEACLKACGGGLSISLNRVEVPVNADPARNPVELDVPGHDLVPESRWSVYTLMPVPGYTGALAIEGKGWRLVHARWHAGLGATRAGGPRRQGL